VTLEVHEERPEAATKVWRFRFVAESPAQLDWVVPAAAKK
jgi:hypothetical protein